MIGVLALAAVAGLAVLLWPWAPGKVAGRSTSSSLAAAGRTTSTSSVEAAPRRAWTAFRRVWSRRAGGRGLAASRLAEVQVLDGLAAALEAGLPPDRALQVALDQVAPGARHDWDELQRAARQGQPLAPAWHRLARRTGSRTAASVARAWAVATSAGAPLAEAVRTSAHAARERHRLERAVEVATAGARATATVLGLLPLAGVGLAAMLGLGPLTLYGNPLALASAGGGLVLLAVGHLSVARMVGAVLRGAS